MEIQMIITYKWWEQDGAKRKIVAKKHRRVLANNATEVVHKSIPDGFSSGDLSHSTKNKTYIGKWEVEYKKID